MITFSNKQKLIISLSSGMTSIVCLGSIIYLDKQTDKVSDNFQSLSHESRKVKNTMSEFKDGVTDLSTAINAFVKYDSTQKANLCKQAGLTK